MPAFVVGLCEEMAPEPMYAYRAGVEATVAAFGGRYRAIVQRYQWETLEGEWPSPFGVLILEFPTYEQAVAWYHSEAYAPLRAMRMAGDRWHIIAAEGLAEGATLADTGILAPETSEQTEG